MRKIELLSPAKNLDCARQALLHGADAIYMGGPGYGARAAAGNSVADIAEICREAHQYGVRIYVTLNTILTNDELQEAEKLIWQLYEVGVDALIVQDMGLLTLHLPPIALHASTQMDNRNAEKVAYLANEGFEQVVLARELSLNEIAHIHSATPVSLEAFVHGALCVSYSGQCYASQYCFGRSANRGECAQFCRMKFDLIDANDEVFVEEKHLLSLRDMNRSQSLEEMMDAGISSFKIEGRLKDAGYVKNVTAFYRQKIDDILSKRSDTYERASYGESIVNFTPQLEKSFNRGFTEYFLHGRKSDIFSPDTPKAIGQRIGKVKQIGHNWFKVQSLETFSNGDGLCYKNSNGKLTGFRVNKVESGKLFVTEIPDFEIGTMLYRNADQAFDKTLSHDTAERRISLNMTLSTTEQGYSLELNDEAGRHIVHHFEAEHQAARSPQHDNIIKQLSKLGNTPYKVRQIDIQVPDNPFIPSSLLTEARRIAIESLLTQNIMPHPQTLVSKQSSPSHAFPIGKLTYLGNVANDGARRYYAAHGVTSILPAFEQKMPENPVIMYCRHCIRYMLGYCPKHHAQKAPWQEPLSLRLGDGRTFPLEFDCKHCEMKVYAPH